MSRGRRPRPAELHIVDGTHREARHGSATELRSAMRERREARLPDPPRWLSPYARAEWRRVARILRERGMLESADRAALACYCRAWSELREATRTIAREGRTVQTAAGTKKLHPAVTVANKAADQIRSFSVEFGLSPTARVRFSAAQGEEDELEKFIREYGDRK